MADDAGGHAGPAWKRVTEGEHRWSASVAVVAAVVLQATLPEQAAIQDRWVLPVLAGGLLLTLVLADPGHINKESMALRAVGMTMIAVLLLANGWSAVRLVTDLVHGDDAGGANRLLWAGGFIWLTNVIAFGLLYWELDRKGPVARAHARQEYPDFLFVQMQSPEFAPSEWEPAFVDYLYLSFTNSAAFSPTDVLPLSRWAKFMMLVQASVSLATIALVVARAVNTFPSKS